MSRAPVHCAAQGCPKVVDRGMLMCKPHWFSLPKPLRDAVWRTWRAYNLDRRIARASGLGHRANVPLMAAYREAVRAAVDYVGTVPVSPVEAFEIETVKLPSGKPTRWEQGRLL